MPDWLHLCVVPSIRACFALAMVLSLCLCTHGCSPPDDSAPVNIVGIDPCHDPWRADTAQVRSTIRFEALVDTALFPLRRFVDSGLRIALVLIPPPVFSETTLPYREFHSYSANYLDLPAVSLALRTQIPPEYFRHFNCARVAAAIVLLHRDENNDECFQEGESIVGICEQGLYLFAQGDLRTVPANPFATIFDGSNILIRDNDTLYPLFRSSPDYHATIFIINARGDSGRYNIPLPWVAPMLFTK